LDERLDLMGREILRASAQNDVEAEAAASPFLYTRIRARIDAERAQRTEGWLSMLKVAWRAVPAMALVAIMAVVLFLSAGSGSLDGFNEEALLDSREAGFEQVVFADNQVASSDDEVLATILNEDDRGASQ
jgi:hypothetical protein